MAIPRITRRSATLALLAALITAAAHANPWAERYDTLCVAEPYALIDQRPDPELADRARVLLTGALEKHGIAYRPGACAGAREFTLLVSVLVDINADGARVTFGLHQDAPGVRAALQRVAAEHHQPSTGADALAQLDRVFATFDAFSIHIDVGTHPDGDVESLLQDARERHEWLLDSFVLSWIGVL